MQNLELGEGMCEVEADCLWGEIHTPRDEQDLTPFISFSQKKKTVLRGEKNNGFHPARLRAFG